MNLKYDKIKNSLYMTLLVSFGVIFSLILLLNIFYPIDNNTDIEFKYNPLLIILGVILFVILLYNLRNIINKLHHRGNIIFFLLCIFTIVIIQTILIKNFSLIHYVDHKHLYSAAIDIKNGEPIGNMSYFSNQYPFQLPMALTMSGIFKFCDILNIQNYKMALSIFNIVFIDLSVLLLFAITKKAYGSKKANIILALCTLSPFIYTYSIYYYTDTLGILFITLSLFLYYVYQTKSNKVWRYLSFFCLSVTAFIGYKIRATVIFVILAIFVQMIFTKKIKEIFKCIAITTSVFIIASIGYQQVEKKYITEDIIGLPSVHWLHMGMNAESEGHFNGIDRKFALHFNTYDERKEFISQDLINRVQKNGVQGTLELFIDKIRSVWTQSNDLSIKAMSYENYNDRLYNYMFGSKSLLYLYYCQAYKSTLYLLVLMSVFSMSKEKYRHIGFVSVIYLIGFFLFYLFWEVKARYILLAYPFILLNSGYGLDFISEKVENVISFRISYNKKYLTRNLNKLLVFLLALIPIFTLFLSISHYKTYTQENINQTSWIIKQDGKNSTSGKILSGDTLSQSFVADKSFNSIMLYATAPNSETPPEYNISLIRASDSEEIKQWNISTTDISKNKIKFFLDDYIVLENSNSEFIIKITTKNATEDNALEFLTHRYKNYDVLQSGTLSLNNKNFEYTDLTVDIYNHYKNPLYSVNTYIFISVFIIIIQLLLISVFLKSINITQQPIKLISFNNK